MMMLYYTAYSEWHVVDGRVHCKRDRQSISVQEWLNNVAHNVDLRLLITLSLLPDDWIVEQTEVHGVELTINGHWLVDVNEDHMTSWHHRYVTRHWCHCMYQQRHHQQQLHEYLGADNIDIVLIAKKWYRSDSNHKCKVKVLLYSLPSVGPELIPV